MEQTARRLVRSRAAALTPPAPAGLRARCVGAATAGAPAAAPAVRTGHRLRRWIPLSVAATAVLAVAGVFMAGQQERLQAAFAAQLALDHEKCFHELGAARPPVDRRAAEARLAAEYGVHMRVPASAAGERIELVGVRSCAYGGGGMAHLLYEVDGQPVSLFVIPESRQPERTLEVVDHDATIWSGPEAAYVLVSQHAADMDKVVAYMRRYGR